MKFITTLTSIIGTFCILAITALLLMIIWGVIDSPAQVWRILISLGIVYFATLLIGSTNVPHPGR